MKNSVHSQTLLTSLLLISMLAVVTQVGVASPTYAQIGVQSTNTTCTTTTNTHGRHCGAVPPGLLNAWAHSNMSVVARAVTHAIFLNGTHGVELAEIAINASSNGQIIHHIAFNETVVQVDFDHDGAVILSTNSSAKPSAIFADDMELSETQSTTGLNENSNAWVFNQNTHKLTIFADPSSVTIFYGPAPTPVPEFPLAYTPLVFLAALAATILLARATVKGNNALSIRRR